MENSDELIEAATHKRKSEVEELLARRFLLPELPARIRAIPGIAGSPVSQLAPEQVGSESLARVAASEEPLARCGGNEVQLAPEQVEVPPAPPERFFLQLTISKSTHDKLQYARALLSHAVPLGDVAQVLDRALDTLILQLERRKFGAVTRRRTITQRPRQEARTTPTRHVPAHVRRAVWERDHGQCTFVSASGTRCKARRFLEFDHIDPVARGGKATVEGIRLRCRAHNQHEAERMFGAGFMARKQREARLGAADARAKTGASTVIKAEAEASARAAAEAQARAAAKEQAHDVLAGLRSLGCRAYEARRAVELSKALPNATLEERMRAALQFLGGKSIQGRAP